MFECVLLAVLSVVDSWKHAIYENKIPMFSISATICLSQHVVLSWCFCEKV